MIRRLNYIAPADMTGYGCAAAQYLRLLAEAGVEVAFQPLLQGVTTPGYVCAPWQDAPESFRRHSVSELFPHADTILHAVPEYFDSLARMLRARGVRGRLLGMTVWETSRLPRHWPDILNRLDAVIVPSEWNKEIFRTSGVQTPIHCLPHSSEFRGHAPGPAAIARLRSRLPDLGARFVFYSIGAWSYRKGNDLLLAAYRAAFRGRDDVALILKTSPLAVGAHLSFSDRLLQKLHLRSGFRPASLASVQRPMIVVLTEELSSEEIAALHATGHAYVSCTRGEGWGIGMYEAGFFAKPILAPDRGGHLAYFPPDRWATLIPSRLTRISMRARDSSYTGDQQWIEVDTSAMAASMQQLVRSPELARGYAEQHATYLKQSLSPEAIRSKFLEILRSGGDDSPLTSGTMS